MLTTFLAAALIQSLPGEHAGISAAVIAPSSPPVALDVPFAPQAPFANWKDPRKRDGCEEASVVMAARWAGGQSLSRDDADREIDALSDLAVERFGSYVDASAADTAALLSARYGTSSRVRYDVSVDDLKQELRDGNLLIVPVNGARLGNPHFLLPAPQRHMIVVRGYDDDAGMFITNDPGTRWGSGYRYSYETIGAAMRDYATGNHVELPPPRTAAVVVSR